MEWMFMPFRRYAEFQGRSRRMEFWMWALFQIIVYIVLTIVMFAVGGSIAALAGDARNPAAMAGLGGSVLIVMLLMGVFWLATIIPSLAVSVRRLHDSGKSGYWLLGYYALVFFNYIITFGMAMSAAASGSGDSGMGAMGISMILSLLSFAYGILLLVFFFLDGTPGENRFGPDPKGRGDEAVFA